MISFSRITPIADCLCPACRQRRKLESKRDIAKGVLVGHRPFVTGLDGPLFPADDEDIIDMIGALDDAIDQLGETNHGPARRRRERSVGAWMRRQGRLREGGVRW